MAALGIDCDVAQRENHLLSEWAEGVYIAEGPTVPFFGCPYPTRSVIIRINASDHDGQCEAQAAAWIWSPVAYNKELAEEIELKVGPVKFIVSPNKIHHIFLGEWVAKYPAAIVYLPPGLRERSVLKGKLPLDDSTRVKELVPVKPSSDPQKVPWYDSVDYLNVGGSLFMDEVVFFHKESKTLVVGDLIQRHTLGSNPALFAPGKYFWIRKLMTMDGILGLDGSTPREWRLSFPIWKRTEIRSVVSKILDNWQPEGLIVAHGECAKRQACEIVQKALSWV